MVCLAISSAALSLAPYFFGKVINYSIPGTNWYDSMYPKVSILYLASKLISYALLCYIQLHVLIPYNGKISRVQFLQFSQMIT